MIDALIQKVRNTPESIEFNDVIAVIANNYDYIPTTFHNGDIVNVAGSNEGSCKIFCFVANKCIE